MDTKRFQGVARIIRSVADAAGYCVQCRSTQTMRDAVEARLKNERVVIIGSCEVCGTEIYKTRS